MTHAALQRVWVWTQCVAIDASVAGTIIRTFRYRTAGEKVKTYFYVNFEAFRITGGVNRPTISIPTPAERTGERRRTQCQENGVLGTVFPD